MPSRRRSMQSRISRRVLSKKRLHGRWSHRRVALSVRPSDPRYHPKGGILFTHDESVEYRKRDPWSAREPAHHGRRCDARALHGRRAGRLHGGRTVFSLLYGDLSRFHAGAVLPGTPEGEKSSDEYPICEGSALYGTAASGEAGELFQFPLHLRRAFGVDRSLRFCGSGKVEGDALYHHDGCFHGSAGLRVEPLVYDEGIFQDLGSQLLDPAFLKACPFEGRRLCRRRDRHAFCAAA